jgi:hypothetical protein
MRSAAGRCWQTLKFFNPTHAAFEALDIRAQPDRQQLGLGSLSEKEVDFKFFFLVNS